LFFFLNVPNQQAFYRNESSLHLVKFQGGWTEENWEEEMENHPFFATGLKDPQGTTDPVR
jgi:hypothetical protein